MLLPDFVTSLCRSISAFHLGDLLSSSEEGTPSLSIEDTAKQPEVKRQRHPQEEAAAFTPSPSSSSSSTNPSSASDSSSSHTTSTSDTDPDTPVMAYPLSDMRSDTSSAADYAHSMGFMTSSTAGLSTADYTLHTYHYPRARDDDDPRMQIADPSNTSTPVRPRTPRSFMHNHSTTDTSSSTSSESSSGSTNSGSPLSDSTNITTPSTTNGSATKAKPKRPSRGFYPLPTYCSFFSSPDLENVERTRELWRHRLEQARRRATGFPIAREAELKSKAGYIKRMDWIEGFRWELPSEFEQYMFLVKLQAEEARRDEERALRAAEDSSDSDGSSSDSTSSSDFGDGEGSSVRGQTNERGSEEEEERTPELEPPSSRDIADFGRGRELDDVKARLEELHRNAKAFSNRPLFEDAQIFDDDEEDDIVGAGGRHGAQGIDFI